MNRLIPAAVVLAFFAGASNGQLTSDWTVIAGGGGTASGATYESSLTIGQSVVLSGQGSNGYNSNNGYWSGVANGAFCLPDLTTINTNPGDPQYGSPDGAVNGADLSFFVEAWLNGNIAIADLTTINTNPGDPGYGIPDGAVNGADLSFFVEAWLNGCP